MEIPITNHSSAHSKTPTSNREELCGNGHYRGGARGMSQLESFHISSSWWTESWITAESYIWFWTEFVGEELAFKTWLDWSCINNVGEKTLEKVLEKYTEVSKSQLGILKVYASKHSTVHTTKCRG